MRPPGRWWLDRLLRLYPREYRERFGDGMRETLRQQLADAKASGRVAALLFLVRTVRDAVLIGVTERCARLHRPSGTAVNGREQGRVALSLLASSVVHDVRYAIRSLSGQPMFTSMTLLALVVGIGLNTSLVSALDAVFFRPWDVSNADRLVRLLSLHPRHGYGGLPIASVAYFEEHARTLEGVFAQRFHTARAGDAADGEPVRVSLVSGSYFDVLQVGVALGRSFSRLEDVPGSAIAVGVMSYDFWRTRYGGDPAVIGMTIHIDGVPFTVIGVTEASFRGSGSDRPDVWVPLSSLVLLRPLDSANLARLTDPEFCCSDLYGRLSTGHTHTEAAAELGALYRRFSRGAQQDEIDVAVVGTALFDHPKERGRVAGIAALSLTVFVSILLLACANVSNMLIARGTARQHEIGIRMAIGAGRGRVVRQLLTECFVLAAIAGGASVLLAPLLPHLLMRLRNQPLPEQLNLALDGTVVAVAMGISAVSVVLFGVAPALKGTRVRVAEALKGGRSASGRFRFQGFLITVQVAVSVALLATAGLLIRGLDRAYTLDPGFRTEGITALRVQLPRNRYNPARERAFFDALESALESAGVPNGMAALVPFGETMNFTDFVVQGASPNLDAAMLVHDVTPGYLQMLEIPILAGRSFLRGDRERGAILVNESLARLHWPGRNPIGETVTIGKRPREVIGVVRDARLHGFSSGGAPMYFAPLAANSQGGGEPLVVLVPTQAVTRASDLIRRADRDAIIETVSLTEQRTVSLADSRGAARLAALLACVALLLATSGVYGVVSYSVEQRRREIGTRIALGARPHAVIALVLRRDATPLCIGLVAGLALAGCASVVLRSQLYGLDPLDPTVFTGLIVALVAAGFAASAIPARRAVRVDPITALRQD